MYFSLLALAAGISLLANPVFSAGAGGGSGAADANSVIRQLIRRTKPVTEQVQVRMKLLDAKNQERDTPRAFTLQSLYVNDADLKSLLVFQEPAGIRGTKILTVKSGEDTGQWIYLPSFRKTNRINSDDDVEGVLDSDLSYSDLKGESTGDYVYKFEPGKPAAGCDGQPGQLISGTPRGGAKTPYAKRLLTIGRSRMVLCEVTLFDQAGKKVKSIRSSGFAKFGEHWRPARTVISSYDPAGQPGTRTELEFSDWKIGQKLNSTVFSPSALER